MTAAFTLKKIDGSVILDVDDANGLKVGANGSAFSELRKYSQSLDVASVATNTSAEQTFTVTGLVAATDVVLSVIKPTATAGLGIVGWRVSADNTLAITFMNTTAGALDPAAETYTIVVARFA